VSADWRCLDRDLEDLEEKAFALVGAAVADAPLLREIPATPPFSDPGSPGGEAVFGHALASWIEGSTEGLGCSP
jgi:hypothetical protein